MNSHSREYIHRHYQEPESSNCYNHYKGNDESKDVLRLLPEREMLFSKVVTRSDIKQYRLAIPKHQAKHHFPPHLVSSSYKSSYLSMEDNEGKVWRFKYSFWKSSQGYMLTKEWNLFVKEKRVNVGDVVSFFCSTGPNKRLFIDWKPQNQSGRAAKPELLELGQLGQTVMLFGVNISTNSSPNQVNL